MSLRDSSALRLARFLGLPALTGFAAAVLVLAWINAGPFAVSGTAPQSYASAVRKAAPAVVNIYTTQQVPSARLPDTPFFNRFMQEPRRQRVLASLGSGVIMRPEGYILTSYHVIRHADGIVVALQDGREARARVVGVDPGTDLALLKVDLNNLPVIELADPGSVTVGDVVLAIGNPLGVGQTVSMGIVSATGRSHLGIATFENFIQTDAAINRGNSGGALINTRGQLIGINTAILSPDGSWTGIAFAIPASMARRVVQDLIQHGRVIRGWLGVSTRDITPKVARRLGMQRPRGTMITHITPGSPADKAGLKRGDVLVAVNGHPVADGYEAMNRVAQTQPGEQITLTLLRLGQKIQRQVTVGLRPLSL